MISLLRNLIRRATVTAAGSDDKDVAVQQVTYLGKTGDCEIVFPYGMHANLPEDAILLMYSVQANSENRAGIGGVPKERIKNLPEKEVVFFHPFTKSKIHFRNNSDIDIETNGNVNINCINANVDCTDVNLTCDTAVANISATFDITCPTTTFTGNVIVNGLLNVSGIATLGGLVSTGIAGGPATIAGGLAVTGTMISNGKNVSDSHNHHYTWTHDAGDDDTDGVN